ncbi:MAG TPA: hypothetical protein DCS21_11075, partial [Gammaproteobacteria bacterium]|nr:hypothetical protein [Gammaproteobacteria bacterium]
MKSEFEVLSQFRAALESRGIIPPEPIEADGKIHRCDVQGKHGKNDAAYLLFLDGYPAGGFQNWKDGLDWQDWTLQDDRPQLTKEERNAANKRIKAIKDAREAEHTRRQGEARTKAANLQERATPAPADHPYLISKKVSTHGLRVYKDALVIPVRNSQGHLLSLQFINAKGEKRFLSGGETKGGFYLIGQPGDTICIAEGFATAASIYEATGYPVAAAFSAGNLLAVAAAFSKAYPQSRRIICADDDYQTDGNPGCTLAKVAATKTQSLLVIPDFGKHRPDGAKDFNDLANVRSSMEVMLQITSAAEPGADQLEMVCLDDITAEPVQWLWPDRFPLGKFSVIGGDPGLGKTQLLASMTAVVTTGGRWPVTGESFNYPADVLILSAEDDAADTIKPRLMAAEADIKRCHILGSVVATSNPKNRRQRRCFNLADDLALLERALKRHPMTRLVWIDPLSAYMIDADRKTDTHRTSDVRSILMPLAELASTYRVAVIGVFHLNKREGSSALNRFNGSGAFVAAARAAWLVAKDKADKRHRVLVPVKNNLAAEQDGLKFEIRGTEIDTPTGPVPTSHVFWLPDRVMIDADEALAGGNGSNEHRSVLEEVMAFLEELLAPGPKFAREVFAATEEAGYIEKTVKRAKEKMGIVAVKVKGQGRSGGWLWSLEGQEGQEGQ